MDNLTSDTCNLTSAALPPDLLPWAGAAAAPRGWRALMRERPEQARRAGAPALARLTDGDFGRVIQAVQDLWRTFVYRPDVEETWQRPLGIWLRVMGWWRWRLAGDCEDFALELRARLIDLGIPPGALRLVQCWTEHGEPHLVLALDTAERGTLILDNRRASAHWRRHQTHGYRFQGGVTEVHGRPTWAWNLQAPSLADLLTLNRKPS